MIPYGHSIVGKVYHKFNLDGVNYGCTEGEPPFISDPPKVDASPIVIIDRGECSFVTKVRNVESNQGHVALIINNSTEKDVSNTVMSDNGNGMAVNIPGVIISKSDGDKIKQFLKANENVQPIFEVEFTMENKTNVVQYDLWYTPDQPEVYRLLSDFYPYQSTLKEHAFLNIHLYTFTSHEYDYLKEKPIEDCLSSGKFCIRHNLEGKGQDVLKEGIRQKCVYNYAYGKGKEPQLFWTYMRNFYGSCFYSSAFTQECSYMALKDSKIPVNQISACYATSFDMETAIPKDYELTHSSSILDADLELKEEWFINKVPSLFVNKRIFLSSWRGAHLFEAVCAGLIKKPEYCFVDGYFAKEKGYSTSTIIFIVLLIVFINAVIFYFCIRFIRRMVEDQLHTSNLKFQVNETVENYLRMREGK